jgi:proteasome-associated ATPase
MNVANTNCKQVVDDLTSKVTEYEQMIQQFLDEQKPYLGTLLTSGFTEQGKQYFRCSVDDKDQLVTFSQSFLFDKSELEVGKEVVIVNGSIIGIVPKELGRPKQKNTFPLITWDEIRGLDSQLSQIKETVQMPLLHPKIVREFGMEPIKGMLLYGPPGCGKTLISKAIASEVMRSNEGSDETFYYLKGGELLSKYVGETEDRIVTMFKRARNYARENGNRVVIFIDEAEAILPARGSRISSDVERTIVPTFLSEMDGFDDNSPFVLLATNYPQQIDEAVMREGRIDVRVEISRPTKSDAIDIMNLYLKKVKVAEDENVLAKEGAEFLFTMPVANRVSGAMLKTVVNNATKKAVSRFVNGDKKKKGVVLDDIHYSIKSLN